MRSPRHQLRRPPRRNGTILIVTMLVCFALAGAVLALSRTMRVEMIASANGAASIQAAAVERGAEQYVLNLLQQNGGPGTLALTEDYFTAQQVGDGYFWILRPAYDDDTLPIYGLVDEQSKLNINSATADQLMLLPNMTDDTAQAIVDWRRGSSNDTYYSTLPQPYMTKGAYSGQNNPYETLEELLMVRGVTQYELFGDGTVPTVAAMANNLPVQSMTGTVTTDIQAARGWADLLTVYSLPAGTGNNQRYPINVNTAPREVLLLLSGLTSQDVDQIITSRPTLDLATADLQWVNNGTTDIPNLRALAAPNRNIVTGTSNIYSADILAVSGNGRAFKRVKIVIDIQQVQQGGPPLIKYHRDISDKGWPLDPQILAQLRNGQGLNGYVSTSGSSMSSGAASSGVR